MSQAGEHTWDMHLEYRSCPVCERIFEDRSTYKYVLGHYEKEAICPYCLESHLVVKTPRPAFGPLFGEE